MDEFIHLTNINNIKTYLGDIRFNHCNVIYLNQVVRTDNEQIYYNNKSLFERFHNFNLLYLLLHRKFFFNQQTIIVKLFLVLMFRC